jgi:hypothetical protein
MATLRSPKSTARRGSTSVYPVRTVSASGHERPKGDVCVESVRLPTADIGRRGRTSYLCQNRP